MSHIIDQAEYWHHMNVPTNVVEAMEQEETSPELELEQHYKRFGTGLKLTAGLFVAGAVLGGAGYGIKDYVIPYVVENAQWILLAITALLSLVVLVYVIGWIRVEAYPRVAAKLGWEEDDDE